MGLLARVKGQRGHGADRNETVKFYQKMKEGEGGYLLLGCDGHCCQIIVQYSTSLIIELYAR